MKEDIWQEYYDLRADLRERIRTGSIDVIVLNKQEADGTSCFFCFDKPGELHLVEDGRKYPIDRACYEQARTHVYVDGKTYELN